MQDRNAAFLSDVPSLAVSLKVYEQPEKKARIL